MRKNYIIPATTSLSVLTGFLCQTQAGSVQSNLPGLELIDDDPNGQPI